mgnify:CR=1 FL=1
MHPAPNRAKIPPEDNVTRTIPTLTALTLLCICAWPPSPKANEKIRHEVYGAFAASTVDEVTFQSNMPGFAVGYEMVPWRYLLVGATAGYQAPTLVDNRGLVYRISMAEGMVYLGARISLDRLRPPRADADPSIGSGFLGANEFALGATLGLSHYIQEVRGEAERTATQPFAGIFLCWNIWFLDWMGLHFNAMFHWNLTELIPGKKGILRKEIHLGPTFRF